MVREILKTSSDSSAKRMELEAPGVNHSASRHSDVSKGGPLGDRPVSVGKEVKYKQYANDQRMTEDFGSKAGAEKGQSPLDGMTEMNPTGEPASSFIDTSHSSR